MRHLSATMRAKTTLWMCVALAAAIMAAWLMVVLATPTKRAEAAFPGKNGKIAFVSGVGGAEIFTMKANGDNQTQLTKNDRGDYNPAFSANGKKIAFERNRSGNFDIFTMSANGTHQKRVTRSESPDFDPAWSPDGTRIAFVRRNCGGCFVDLYSIRADGSSQIRLTTTSLGGLEPAWSRDGTKIAFRSTGTSEDVNSHGIYVMNAAPESETNSPKRLTGTRWRKPSFAPDWQPLR